MLEVHSAQFRMLNLIKALNGIHPVSPNRLTTVEPLNKGHFGNGSFVLSSEVVPISEVHRILMYYIFISSLKRLKWVDNQLGH